MPAKVRTQASTNARTGASHALVNPSQQSAMVPARAANLHPLVSRVLASAGAPLDPATRAFMEPRFGFDFSQVRVHTDSRAVESARAVNALAYAVGRDLVFDAGQYAPYSVDGKRLLAHELTHVVQQSRRSHLTEMDPGAEHERHAHSMATAVMQGKAPTYGWVYTGVGLARQPKAAGDPEIAEITEGTGTSDKEPYLVFREPGKSVDTRRLLAKDTRVQVLSRKDEWRDVRVLDGENKDQRGLIREKFIRPIPAATSEVAPKPEATPKPEEAKKDESWANKVHARVPSKDLWENSYQGKFGRTAVMFDLLLLAKSYCTEEPKDRDTAIKILRALKQNYFDAYLNYINFDKKTAGMDGIMRTFHQQMKALALDSFNHIYSDIINEKSDQPMGGWDAQLKNIKYAHDILYILAGEDAGSMTPVEKLAKAKDYAIQLYLKEDVRQQVNALLSPQSLALMAAFAAVYIAAQVTPAGWVADALALTVITISAVFVGSQLLSIFKHILGYLAAVNAKSEDDLKEAGHELSEAIAEAGLSVFVALLTHGVKGAVKGAIPYDPPPSGMADAVTDTGLPIRVPVQDAPAALPASVPVDLASKAVAVPPETQSLEEKSASEGKESRAEPKKIQQMKSQNRPWSNSEVFQSLKDAIARYRKNVQKPRVDLPESSEPVRGGTVAAAKTDVDALQGKLYPGASSEALPTQLKGQPGTKSEGLLSATSELAENHAEQVALENLASDLLGLQESEMAGKKVWLLVEQEPCPSCASGIDTAAVPGPIKQFSLAFPELTIEIQNLRTSRSFRIKNGKSI